MSQNITQDNSTFFRTEKKKRKPTAIGYLPHSRKERKIVGIQQWLTFWNTATNQVKQQTNKLIIQAAWWLTPLLDFYAMYSWTDWLECTRYMQLVTASTYSDQVTIAHIVICVLLQSRVYKLNKKGQSIYMRNLFVLTICQLEKKESTNPWQ